MIEPGTQAPNVRLADLDGGHFDLREALKQGPVVLAFFKISCPTCQMTFPYLQRLADAPDCGTRIVAISQDNVEDTREFHQRFGISMRTLIDTRPAYKASNDYRIGSVPSIFVIEPDVIEPDVAEPDGVISFAVEGFHKAALADLGRLFFRVATFRETDHVPALRPG